MVAPAMALAAYKEKDNLFKVIIYAFLAIAVLYFLYKVFKGFEGLKNAFNKLFGGLKEGINEIKKYGLTKQITPKETAEITSERAQEKPDKPYLVEKNTYESLKKQGYKLPSNVKPYSLKESMKESKVKVEREQPTIGTKLGLWTPKKEEKQEEEKKEVKQEVKPTYKTNEQIMSIEGERWQARAEKFLKTHKEQPKYALVQKANPAPKQVVESKIKELPIHRTGAIILPHNKLREILKQNRETATKTQPKPLPAPRRLNILMR